MKFELKKGLPFFILLVLVPACIIIYALAKLVLEISYLELNQLLVLLAIFSPVILIVYLLLIKTYYNSFYTIENEKIVCKLGLFKKTIRISQINSIKKGNYQSAGFKPALAFSGIHINYGEGYTIFLTPKNLEKFMDELKSLNAKIKIF